MKKLITICFFMATIFAVNAQEKKTTAAKPPVKKVTKTETAITTPVEQKGPTKEQTVTFIMDYFADHQFIGRKMDSQSKTSYRNIKAIFNDCLVTISWDDSVTYFNMTPDNLNKTYITKYEAIIDFKNIESVTIRPYGNDEGNQQYQADLTLKAAPNTTFKITSTDKDSTGKNNLKEVNIPVNSYSCDSCDHYQYSKKIHQAFNHLRKLCGAPEPIDFGN